MATSIRAVLHSPSFKTGTAVFWVMRIFLTIWAIVALAVSPLPKEPNEVERPYLGQPILNEGIEGLILGPWQRFDTLHYTRIAALGYVDEADSVFPPLFPMLIQATAMPLGNSHSSHMFMGMLISNLACWALFILFHYIAGKELGTENSTRTLVYYAIFPTAFFLVAPYTESLFLLLALASLWLVKYGRFGWAGVLGFTATLTRNTGALLVVPFAYQFWEQCLGYGKWKIEPSSWSRQIIGKGVAVLLPAIAFLLFVLYRTLIGLPSLGRIYNEYWYQETGIPGQDLLRALNTMFLGAEARSGELTLWFDFFIALLLLITTIVTFKRLGMMWGLYSAVMLFFIFLPTSDLKPLYSFSRYALAFFPTFLLFGEWGRNGWINRLILYPSIILYLYFSGQYFIWGWVA